MKYVMMDLGPGGYYVYGHLTEEGCVAAWDTSIEAENYLLSLGLPIDYDFVEYWS